MGHKETVRIVPGAKTAVLFLHGISGSPRHFRELLPLEGLVPQNWSVYNILLPGHGGSVKDFGRSRMEAWKGHVQLVLQKLAETHENILIVGHSMGTLFALQAAKAMPEKVAGLFLVASPLYIHIRPSIVRDLLLLNFGAPEKDSPVVASIRRACGIRTTWKLWEYIGWIPRLLELFREIRLTRKLLADRSVPCVAYQSDWDEFVSNRSGKLLESNGIDVFRLRDSTHFHYTQPDNLTVQKGFLDFVEKYKKQGE